MAHVSRPFQIVLVVFVLFVAVWFVALRDHTSSTTGAGSSTPPPSPVSKTSSSKPSSTTKPAHSTAHATVVHATTTAKANAEHGAATTVTTTTTSHVTVVKHHAASRPTTVAATTVVGHRAVTAAKPVAAKPSTSKSSAEAPAPAKPATGLPKMQVAVERQLQQGKTVLILFWNPNGYDDAVVHGELPAVQRSAHGPVAVHYAAAKQVGEYGTITNAVQVDQTPTLLIVEPHGQTTTITGLTDAFAIDQAIVEARAAAAKAAAK